MKATKTVLVTGGAGFIGSHLTEALLSRGYMVRVLDNLSQGRTDWLASHPSLEFRRGDICDLQTCIDACKDMHAVFHLAAMSKVAPSLENESMLDFCTTQNVLGTLNLLKAAHRSQARKFIYSASSTAYGRTPPPHREASPPDCLNPYALTKYLGEQYCELYDKLYGLPTLSLRYFQVYGPRQPSSGNYAVVTGIFLEQRKSGTPLTIHGDGSQRRDFVYVGDVAEANIRALESPVHGTVINVGTGTSHSIKEIADLISADQMVGMPRRPGDMDETRADTSRCRSLLQWCPSTPLVPTLLGLVGF